MLENVRDVPEKPLVCSPPLRESLYFHFITHGDIPARC